jgi:arylsulfatase A-like enzyme
MIDRAWLAAFLAASAIGVSGAAQAAPNILLIFGDDMGVETLASYGVGENPPTTATLDELAADGMRFANFWVQPVCSPTRATVITGRYGFRTGIGRPVGGPGPLPERPDIPEWASPAPAASGGGAGGMGGMGGGELRSLPRHGLPTSEYADAKNGWLTHPNDVGFDHFSGLIAGTVDTYFAWTKVVNGEPNGGVGYTATDKTNDAIEWIGEQGDDPWFVWFAFNLPHTPIHLPPEELWQEDHSDLDRATIDGDRQHEYFNAMIEAMDTEIGRLLDSMDPDVRENTYVIFLGDNGTTGGDVRAPFQQGRSKGSVYQGGVHTPLIVAGPGIEPGTVPDVIVNSTDLFTTIMELAEIDPAATIPDNVVHDSISFASVLSDANATPRDWVYVDEFFGGWAGIETADYAMRDERFKLVRFDMEEQFYDLLEDPYEHNNLLESDLSVSQRSALIRLRARVRNLRESESE